MKPTTSRQVNPDRYQLERVLALLIETKNPRMGHGQRLIIIEEIIANLRVYLKGTENEAA